ncbi:MAG: RecQ family ATP-dependent DNA helicase [Bacteroidota bacterium]
MDSLPNVMVFDLETTAKASKVHEIGAYLNGQSFRYKQLSPFAQLVGKARWWCGHNIVDHDLCVLKKVGFSADLLNKPAIDTLYLSALLFPKRPYHKLIKGYQLMGTDLNDPLADAQLAAELLENEIHAFRKLSGSLQNLYYNLLHQESGFAGFFEFLEGAYPGDLLSDADLLASLRKELAGRICEKAALLAFRRAHPMELAYATALLLADDPYSVPPGWLLHRFPKVQDLIDSMRLQCRGPALCPACKPYEPKMALERWFGYPSFRKFPGDGELALQEQVVRAALDGQSFLAIFPTGGGKSLTFQLPALIRGEASRSLTVVISPLQSLMKDQVDVLQERFGITSAVTINGMLSPLERSEAIERVAMGEAHLLYISPESLRSNTILRLLVNRHIDRFVIDEAHCFSSWGQDFRVDYLYIGRFLRKLREKKNLAEPIPVSCFTATAKPAVVVDICNYFLKKNLLELQLFQTSSKRDNLQYFVYKAEGADTKFERLLGLLRSEEGPKIVYVSRVKTATELAVRLKAMGLEAEAYHGKLEPEDKTRIQDAFMSDTASLQIIVATTAFGMGVDKKDICMVVHYDISDSLENYLQESGRAGRDANLQARCYILFDENDLSKHFFLLNQTKLNRKEIQQIWQGIKRFQKKQFSKSALEIARQAGWEEEVFQLETRVKTAIAVLEQEGFVRREENSGQIFTQSILVKNTEEANRLIDQHASNFSSPEEQEQAKRIFGSIISRSKAKLDIRIDYMADTLGIPRDTIAHLLPILRQIGILRDDKDLTAYFYTVRGARNSRKVFERLRQVEQALWDLIFVHPTDQSRKVFLRELNEQLHQQDIPTELSLLTQLLNYGAIAGLIKKERINRIHQQYEIRRMGEASQFQQQIKARLTAAAYALQVFERDHLPSAQKDNDFTDKVLLDFSLLDLKAKIESYSGEEQSIQFYEKLLLYLHHCKVIELKSGLLVYYNPMRIVRTEMNTRRYYTQEDYKTLDAYYKSRIAQIHIVGEYARKQLTNAVEATQFAEDYFTLPYEEFLQKYFRRRKGKLHRPITEEKFQRIFGQLSSEQIRVINDKDSQRILVAAGPGSGKTRVLVHKVAALLLMEDIKPLQFLMLTFSRPAAMEFRQRLFQLVGPVAYHIDIFTYQGYAFRLAGRMGNLEKSRSILSGVTQAIRSKELSVEQIRSKAVIVVDEFQDVSDEEYDFLTTIIGLAIDPRVIAVGDDDQNIYEFRGANLQHMRNFVREQQAKIYYLTKNFRAKANLLAFSNLYLRHFLRGDRLKKNIELEADQEEHGSLELIQYKHPHLLSALVDQLERHRFPGRTAILTHTNEEARLLYSLLQEKDIPAQLMAGQSGFRVDKLLEVAGFTHWLHKAIADQSGSIREEDWQQAKSRCVSHFQGSQNLELLHRLLDAFEKDNPRKFLSNWRHYLSEIRPADLYAPESARILVATMHKVKGKEFDNVYLLLQNHSLQSEEQRRVLYVAITRAKERLYIHTDGLHFPTQGIPQLLSRHNSDQRPASHLLLLECGLKDVWLGHFKKEQVQYYLRTVLPGQLLHLQEDRLGLWSEAGDVVCRFSKAFGERLQQRLRDGYAVRSIRVDYVVLWHDRESDREYRVVLPRVELEKSTPK